MSKSLLLRIKLSEAMCQLDEKDAEIANLHTLLAQAGAREAEMQKELTLALGDLRQVRVALSTARADADVQKAYAEGLHMHIDGLRAEAEAMREVLDRFADSNNWDDCTVSWKPQRDLPWEIARAALQAHRPHGEEK